MNEENVEAMLDEAINQMQNSIELLNSNQLIQPPESSTSESSTFIKLYKETEQFAKLCHKAGKAFSMNQAKSLNAKGSDFICNECESFFQINMSYTKEKCTLCCNHADLNLLHVLEHKVEFLHCEICDMYFDNLSSLYTHIDVTHSYIFYNCFCCDELFQLKYSIVYHMLFEHKLKKGNILKVIEYRCVHCKKIINNIVDLRTHINNSTNHFRLNSMKDNIDCMICKKEIKEVEKSVPS